MTFRLTHVTFVPRVVPALRLSLVLDYTLFATSDLSPCTSSRPFVTNYTSLGFHLAENAAFVSPSGSTRRLGCSQTGSCRFVTRVSLTKCVFVTPIFYNFNLSCITLIKTLKFSGSECEHSYAGYLTPLTVSIRC